MRYYFLNIEYRSKIVILCIISPLYKRLTRILFTEADVHSKDRSSCLHKNCGVHFQLKSGWYSILRTSEIHLNISPNVFQSVLLLKKWEFALKSKRMIIEAFSLSFSLSLLNPTAHYSFYYSNIYYVLCTRTLCEGNIISIT